jgi:hypothetical protein
VINLDVLGPFQVLKPALTLRPKETKRGSEKAGPVGWWKLDESGGTTAANAAGASLAGQFHGAPRWAPDQGRQQGAVEFGPASGWIECTESADLDLRDSVAVAVWMKARAGEKGGVLLAKGASWSLQRPRWQRRSGIHPDRSADQRGQQRQTAPGRVQASVERRPVASSRGDL